MANMSITGLLEQRKRVFYGWWIAIAGAIQDAIKGGTFNEGFLFYFLPITRDFGIARAATSLPFSIAKLEGAFEGPLVGYLIDRFGPRVMVMAGGLIAGLGFILLSFTHSYLFFLIVFVGVLSLGFKAGFNHAMMAAINQWFIRRKGLAMSIVSTGSAVGGLVITPLVALAVFTLGWRSTAFISGLAIWLIVIPLALLVKRSPEEVGLLPDGRTRPADAGRSSVSRARETSDGADFTVREAIRTPAFWFFTMAQSFRNTAHGGIIVHLVPIMVWKGIDEQNAIYYVEFMLFSVLGLRLFMGWWGDSWSRQKVATIGVTLGALGLVLLSQGSGQWWQVATFVFLLAGAESINSNANAMVGDFFGRKSFATVRGWIGLVASIIPIPAPVFTGWVYDQTQSYSLAIFPFVGAYLLSALLFWLTPKPRLPLRAPRVVPEASETIVEQTH